MRRNKASGRRAIKRLAKGLEAALGAAVDQRIELAVEKRLAHRDGLLTEQVAEAVDARFEALAEELGKG